MIAVDTHEANINVTIDGIKWLDYGSIKEIDGYLTLRSFVEIGYLIGRYLLDTYQDIQGRINIDLVRNFHEELKAISDMDLSKPEAWLKLNQFVESLSTAELQYTHWSDEYTLESDIDRPESRNGKGIGYWSLLQEIDFETVTDIACNKGYFGFLAAKKAKSVIGFDYVPKCIAMAYELNEKFKLPIIFAAKSVEDFITNENYETSRFKSDLVVALAIVHHIKIFTFRIC
ncbi:MAG: class I SAM-dependent methyltransferase [Thioploca sp.]|nr:class I SAM-dependent methyltransferase [Thioploca sp.]